MSIYYSDNFNSYPVGPAAPGVPTGFILNTNFGNNIVDGGIQGSHAWQLIGQAIRFIPPTATLSHWMGIWAEQGQTQNIFAFINTDPLNILNGHNLLTVHQETDASLSFIDLEGTLYKNSSQNNFYLTSHDWFFMQLNLTVTSDLVGGVSVLKLIVECSIEGLLAVTGQRERAFYFTHTHTTNTPVAAMFSGGADSNGGIYNLAGYLVDNITMEDQTPIGNFPNPGTTIRARVSNDIVEVAKLPIDQNIRVTSDVVEIVKRPSTARVRVSSDIIELAVTGFKRRSKWVVKES